MVLVSTQNSEVREIKNTVAPRTLVEQRPCHIRAYEWRISGHFNIEGDVIPFHRELNYGQYDYFELRGKWYKIASFEVIHLSSEEVYQVRRGRV